MNIAFLENNFSPTVGGVERVTFTIGEGLRSRGYGIYYIFRGEDSSDGDGDFKYAFNETEGVNSLYAELKSYIQNKNIRIVVCQNLHSSQYAYIYKRLKFECGIRIVSVLHCNPDIWVNKNRWGDTTKKIYFKELFRSLCFSLFTNPYKVRQKKMYEVSDRYVLLSEKYMPVFCRLNKVDGVKLSFIENPCFFEDNNNPSVWNKENIVLIVSRMAEQQKRILGAIKIWNNIYRLVPEWKMVVVGDGPDTGFYKAFANKNKIERISFIGSSTHVENFYTKAKIFLMTSIWEGFPLTLVEAQHYGCVPLAYDSYAAVSDIIKDGYNGFIIPLHNIGEYIKRLSTLMNDGMLLSRMSQCAWESSKTILNKESILDKWERLFKELQ